LFSDGFTGANTEKLHYTQCIRGAAQYGSSRSGNRADQLQSRGIILAIQRGLTGAFHKVSLKHLQRYLNEFSFRFNNRKAADLFGMILARMAAVGAMPYAKLVEENAFTPFVRSVKTKGPIRGRASQVK
jgi:hypothetical protein